MEHYRLFIGNPGVGKSTLINCLAEKVLFKSGVSIGGGMTYQLEEKKHNGITFMDTPGLADIKLRKAAAQAITKALKKNGTYQIFFVVTLEAGRVRAQDLTAIRLVLENATAITSYSLIVNKLTPRLYKELLGDEGKKMRQLVAELNFSGAQNVHPPEILLLLRKDQLDDADNAFAELEGLKSFVENAPCVKVIPNHVRNIPSDDYFDKQLALMQNEIDRLQRNNEEMRIHLQQTEKRYREMQQGKHKKVALFSCLVMFDTFSCFKIEEGVFEQEKNWNFI